MRNYQKPVLEEKTTSFFEVVNMSSGGLDSDDVTVITPTTPTYTCFSNRKHVTNGCHKCSNFRGLTSTCLAGKSPK